MIVMMVYFIIMLLQQILKHMEVKTGSEKYPWKNGQRIDRKLKPKCCSLCVRSL